MLILLLISLNTATSSGETSIVPQQNEYYFEVPSGENALKSITITNQGPADFDYYLSFLNLYQLDENTIAYWDFNEGEGNIAYDKTSLQNTGVIVGGTWVNGRFGKALQLDGWDDYVLVPNSPNMKLSSYTIECWIKLNAVSYWSPIGPVKFWEYGLLYNEGGFFRNHVWADGLKWYDVQADIEDNLWHYIVTTYSSSSGELRLYLNGALVESRYEGEGNITQTENNILIGRGWTESMWNFYNGTIDEIRISNIARSQREIEKTYQRAVHGSDLIKPVDMYGTVEQYSSKQVVLNIDSQNISPGLYNETLVIISTDPLGEMVSVPIQINVTPLNHDISAYFNDNIIYGTAGDLLYSRIIVTNEGNSVENNIKIYHYIDNKVEEVININEMEPKEKKILDLYWSPKISGIYNGVLYVEPVEGEIYIRNNFDNILYIISGTPKINIDEKSITINDTLEEKLYYNMTISNIGSDDLKYIIYDSYSNIIFYDDMETGPMDWEHVGDTNSWEHGIPKIGPEKAYSGQNCWGTSLSGNYMDLTDSVLQSPIIDLRNRKHPVLEFWVWYSINDREDKAYVEIMDNNRWISLNDESYYGYSDGWIREEFDLSNYIGKEVKCPAGVLVFSFAKEPR